MTTLPPESSSVTRRLIVTACALVPLCALLFVVRPARISDVPREAQLVRFVDRSGLLLGAIAGRGERRTIAVPLERISAHFVDALLAAEDGRFFRHGALDGLASIRALLRASPAEVPRGASTISMQLARTLHPVGPGIAGKLREIIAAARLENGQSKRTILEAYCNRAPMGSNLYGVEIAAQTYFGTDAAHLDLAQASLLAALPNDPVRLDPYRHFAALKMRQRYVLARMRASGRLDAESERRAASEHVALRPRALGIVAAPHFLFGLLPRVPPGVSSVRTTLDRPLQQFVEAQVRDVVRQLAPRGLGQAAALVVDNRSGDILAYVGSRDYFEDAALGRNDGVRALRQPGSALKPFLYELALEHHDLQPNSILADVPAAYAIPGARIYRPSDYTNRFQGPVRVRLALASSLNVPAVRTLARVGVVPFLRRLHELGFVHLDRSAEFYGLGLALGAGEVSLAELATSYATLARNGEPLRLRETSDDPPQLRTRRTAPEWALVTDMLADPYARAGAFGVDSILRLPFAASVKTGTSSDFRDTWTIGYTPEYTVAAWAGNFDGAALRGLSGVSGAGPIWARIMAHLYEAHDPPAFSAPRGYKRTAICAETGGLPGAHCKAVVSEWLGAGDRLALVTSPRLGREYDGWLALQPARSAPGPRILFPHDNDAFVYDPGGGGAQRIVFEFADRAGVQISAALDGHALALSGQGYRYGLLPGSHALVLTDSTGATSRIHFSVAPRATQRRTGFTFVRPARAI